MDVIRIGPSGLLPWLSEARRAIRGHIFESGGSLSVGAVRNYFENEVAAQRSPYDDMVASQSPVYRDLLWRIFHDLELNRGSSVLDYGCGKGDLLAEMRVLAPGARYVGYDTNREQISLLRANAEGAYFTSDLDDEQFDVVCVVNVLCYVPNDELPAVISQIRSLVSSGGYLVVTEPWQAWYWETKFDGLRLKLRTLEAVDSEVRRVGLSKRESVVAAIERFGLRPILPVAWAASWT